MLGRCTDGDGVWTRCRDGWGSDGCGNSDMGRTWRGPGGLMDGVICGVATVMGKVGYSLAVILDRVGCGLDGLMCDLGCGAWPGCSNGGIRQGLGVVMRGDVRGLWEQDGGDGRGLDSAVGEGRVLR